MASTPKAYLADLLDRIHDHPGPAASTSSCPGTGRPTAPRNRPPPKLRSQSGGYEARPGRGVRRRRPLARPSASGSTQPCGARATRRSNRSVRAWSSASAPSPRAPAQGLSVRHDHGSQYMSHDFQREIAWLGAASSPAFVRAPEGNGCAERFIRTLKENLLWVRTFQTVEELRLALLEFRQTYNEHWLIERHGYRSPAPSSDATRWTTSRWPHRRNQVSHKPGAVQSAPTAPINCSG